MYLYKIAAVQRSAKADRVAVSDRAAEISCLGRAVQKETVQWDFSHRRVPRTVWKGPATRLPSHGKFLGGGDDARGFLRAALLVLAVPKTLAMTRSCASLTPLENFPTLEFSCALAKPHVSAMSPCLYLRGWEKSTRSDPGCAALEAPR